MASTILSDISFTTKALACEEISKILMHSCSQLLDDSKTSPANEMQPTEVFLQAQPISQEHFQHQYPTFKILKYHTV
jgi:hypothetical protein